MKTERTIFVELHQPGLQVVNSHGAICWMY